MEELAAKKEAHRQSNRESMRRAREKDKENQYGVDNPRDIENIEESGNGKDTAAERRSYYAASEDGGDSEETCWRRGLLYRATNAAGEAKYEDWTQFEIDAELVLAAERAASAWVETAAYLRRLYGNAKS